MPVAERSSQPVRGQKTICFPCSQSQDERVVDDPEAFRRLLDQQIEATPELFPPVNRSVTAPVGPVRPRTLPIASVMKTCC